MIGKDLDTSTPGDSNHSMSGLYRRWRGDGRFEDIS
jgi:hypothetical protein